MGNSVHRLQQPSRHRAPKESARIPQEPALSIARCSDCPGPSSSTKRTASRRPSLCATPPRTKASAVRKMGGNLDTAVVPCTTSQEDAATQNYLTERQSVLLSGNPFNPPRPLHRLGIRSRCSNPSSRRQSEIPGCASGLRRSTIQDTEAVNPAIE